MKVLDTIEKMLGHEFTGPVVLGFWLGANGASFFTYLCAAILWVNLHAKAWARP